MSKQQIGGTTLKGSGDAVLVARRTLVLYHGGERWTEPAYVDHVIGGVRWVLGQD